MPLALRILVEIGIVDRAAIVVFRREHPPIRRWSTTAVLFLFDQEAELVAFARVAVEIQVPGENLRDLQRQLRALASPLDTFKQRSLERPADGGAANGAGYLAHPRHKTSLGFSEPQPVVRVNDVFQRLQITLLRSNQSQLRASAKLPDIELLFDCRNHLRP